MIVRCPTCHVHFDDTFRWTYCPHDTFPANDGSNHVAHHPESFRHADTCERVTHPNSLHPCDCVASESIHLGMKPQHFCVRCHHRWDGDPSVSYCGDCHRDVAWVETRLRVELWLGHGCSIATLYGDDGEMQCNACRVDFKRGHIRDVVAFVVGRRLERVSAALDTVSDDGREYSLDGITWTSVRPDPLPADSWQRPRGSNWTPSRPTAPDSAPAVRRP